MSKKPGKSTRCPECGHSHPRHKVTSFDVLTAYYKLHDGLSDMIEGGRLTEADIPDDYQWLVESLAEIPKSGEIPYVK